MPDWLIDSFLKYVGTLTITGVTASGAAYALFRFFGTKWIDEKFQKRFADYRHKQDKELQRAKFEIDRLLDRSVHFHKWEFEVLPTAWSKAYEAYAHVLAAIGSLVSLPDLNSMTESRLEKFLQSCDLSDIQQEDIRKAPDKTSAFQKVNLWNFMKKTEEVCRDTRLYIEKNSIFMPNDIWEKFNAFLDLIWRAFVERECEERWGRGQFAQQDAIGQSMTQRFGKEAKPMLDELQVMIRSRLISISDGQREDQSQG